MACSDIENKRVTQIYQLDDLTKQGVTENGYGEEFSLLHEYFVVYNPSEDEDSLIEFINEFNRKSISSNDLLISDLRIRNFYRKTGSLTKDYKEFPRGWPEPDETIELQSDALILIVKWADNGKSIEYEIPVVY
ncbi:MAG: hypothetical protein GY787_31480 [Alteromonadales bacterium]|nr:hypothetical protein [Alteromonadales bacterium]